MSEKEEFPTFSPIEEKSLNEIKGAVFRWMEEVYPDFKNTVQQMVIDVEKKHCALEKDIPEMKASLFLNLKEEINALVKDINVPFDSLKTLKKNEKLLEKRSQKFLDDYNKKILEMSEKFTEAERLFESVKSVEEDNYKLFNKLQSSTTFLNELYELKDSINRTEKRVNFFLEVLKKGINQDIIDLNKKIEDCEFSVRTNNILHANEIITVGQLLETSDYTLHTFRNMGKKSLNEIHKFKESLNFPPRGNLT